MISYVDEVISAKTFLGSVTQEAGINTVSEWFESLSGVEPFTKLYKGAWARSGQKFDSLSDSY